jgi:hypothetical protein
MPHGPLCHLSSRLRPWLHMHEPVGGQQADAFASSLLRQGMQWRNHRPLSQLEVHQSFNFLYKLLSQHLHEDRALSHHPMHYDVTFFDRHLRELTLHVQLHLHQSLLLLLLGHVA